MNEPIELEDVQRLRLVPGDILVIRCPGILTDQEVDQLTERTKAQLDKRIQVWVVEGGVSLAVLTPEPTDVIEIAGTLNEEEFDEFRRRWTEAHA